MYKKINDLKMGDLFRVYEHGKPLYFKQEYYSFFDEIELIKIKSDYPCVGIFIIKDNDYAQIFVNSRMYFLCSNYFNCNFEVL